MKLEDIEIHFWTLSVLIFFLLSKGNGLFEKLTTIRWIIKLSWFDKFSELLMCVQVKSCVQEVFWKPLTSSRNKFIYQLRRVLKAFDQNGSNLSSCEPLFAKPSSILHSLAHQNPTDEQIDEYIGSDLEIKSHFWIAPDISKKRISLSSRKLAGKHNVQYQRKLCNQPTLYISFP